MVHVEIQQIYRTGIALVEKQVGAKTPPVCTLAAVYLVLVSIQKVEAFKL
jgi:hypothetical protein